MALVFIEGFDYYAAADATSRGWSGSPSAMPAGRFGGQCWRFSAGSGGLNATQAIALPSTYTTLYAGFAWRFSTFSTSFKFVLRAGTTNTYQVSMNATGNIVVLNSSNATIATGTTALAVNTWYYVETKAVINGASGSCELRLNGASEIPTTTGNFGTTALDHLTLAMNTASASEDFDDIYMLDTTGTDNNTYLGDVRVTAILPTSDGTHTAWTPTGGASHLSQVDDATPDGDTTYVSDATPGDIDTYVFSDVDGSATVFGVQTHLYARKDDANTRQIAPVIRQSGTDYVGSPAALAASYLYYSQLYDKDPTGADWTAANVNGDEFGVKEIA